MRVPIRPVLCLALSSGLCGLTARVQGQEDEVLRWNSVLLNAVRVDKTAPPIAARDMAMVHVAIHDAVNAIAPAYEPYHARPRARPDDSQPAAVAAAAHAMLALLFPGQRATFDAQLQASMAAIPDGSPEAEGLRVGQEAAFAILQLRQGDIEAGQAGPPIPPPGPGVWEPTSPGQPPLLPGWGRIKPFTMRSGDQFRQRGPRRPQGQAFLNYFNQVKALGAKDSAVRTPDQTVIARFWSDGPGTATPPGHWNVIAQDIARRQQLGLAENARVFALLNLALADAGIVAWDMKYTFFEWRPITGIRRGAGDGNWRTKPDPTWEPLLPTPPFPDYVSGHSTFSNAAAEMLALAFGSDRIPFSSTSDDLPGVRRDFPSFSAAADEAGDSRIYGGIHWGDSDKDGARAGRQLARFIFQRHLKKSGAGPARSVVDGRANVDPAVKKAGIQGKAIPRTKAMRKGSRRPPP